jgi:DNA repair protein RadA/Sms
MTKVHTRYVCQNCGTESPRWIGKCPNCGEWNTFAEEVVSRVQLKRAKRPTGESARPVPMTEVDTVESERIKTGLEEFDRVVGGGVVLGSVCLLGGDPGIGKSTLMMQVASRLQDQIVLYITGEESVKQIKLRSERLQFPASEKLLLLAETNMEIVNDLLSRTEPDLVIVDSIQTMYRPELESAPGSVSQVRESTALLMKIAKTKGIPVFIIGHVTKEGIIAGPRVVEHMVDTVLQFEGERHHAYRILRAIKNRFGSTNEIGIFEMLETGLREVQNPSEVFLSERAYGASGSTVVASMEGTRPILVEVQALVTPTSYSMPQRTSTGIDYRRLSLLLAVLEKRVGLHLSSYDVFVNIAGGVRIEEPAVDLGIAASIASSLRDIPVDSQSVAVGEIGLGGEIRTISHVEKRVQEARKLGFKRMIIPKNNLKRMKSADSIALVGVETVGQAMEELLG